MEQSWPGIYKQNLNCNHSTSTRTTKSEKEAIANIDKGMQSYKLR